MSEVSAVPSTSRSRILILIAFDSRGRRGKESAGATLPLLIVFEDSCRRAVVGSLAASVDIAIGLEVQEICR